MAEFVINKNIGTAMLSHYCPVCKNRVFNNNTDNNDEKNCEYCGTNIRFPDTVALMELLGYEKGE